MNAPASLLEQWRKVLVFSIGADNRLSTSQLPDVRKFPREFLIPPHVAAADRCGLARLTCGYRLGVVLGIARLKYCRSFPAECYGADAELDGQEFVDLPQNLRDLEARFGDSVYDGYNSVISTVLEMALFDSERLPTLHAILASLGNDDLHRLAMDAVQCMGDDDHNILAVLYAPREVA